MFHARVFVCPVDSTHARAPNTSIGTTDVTDATKKGKLAAVADVVRRVAGRGAVAAQATSVQVSCALKLAELPRSGSRCDDAMRLYIFALSLNLIVPVNPTP